MKPKIKVIHRSPDFYFDDIRKIEKKEEDWGKIEIMNDLTFFPNADVFEDDEDTEKKGVIICWNKKEQLIEILNYK